MVQAAERVATDEKLITIRVLKVYNISICILYFRKKTKARTEAKKRVVGGLWGVLNLSFRHRFVMGLRSGAALEVARRQSRAPRIVSTSTGVRRESLAVRLFPSSNRGFRRAGGSFSRVDSASFVREDKLATTGGNSSFPRAR